MKCKWAKDRLEQQKFDALFRKVSDFVSYKDPDIPTNLRDASVGKPCLEERVRVLEEMVKQDRKDSYEFFKKLGQIVIDEVSNKRGK